MGVIRQPFGKMDDGRPVERWTLTENRLRASVLTYGAALQTLQFDGVEVALGFDRMEDYLTARCPYIGMVVDVLSYPAHKLYKVKGEEKTYLIPAVKDIFITDIDEEAREISVHMIEGLETDED